MTSFFVDPDAYPDGFRNFRVTIKNDTDGTPSLSESDQEEKANRGRKRKRRRDKVRCVAA